MERYIPSRANQKYASLHAGAVAHTQTGGVAHLAHVGGFIFGAVTARFFEDPRRLALQPPGD